MLLQMGGDRFDLSTRGFILGAISGTGSSPDEVCRGARELVEAGAHAVELEPPEEDAAALVAQLVQQIDVPVSIRTADAALAERCLRTGAAAINDPSGFADLLMLLVAAESGATVIVNSPADADDTTSALLERIRWAIAAGLSAENIIAGESPTTAEVPSMVDLTNLGDEEANGAVVAAMMNGVRVLRTTNVKAVRRVAATVSELLMRRGVGAPNAVAPLGGDTCR